MTDSGRIMAPIFTRETIKNGINKKPMRKMIQDGDVLYICCEMAANFVVEEYELVNEVNPKINYFFAPCGLLANSPATVPFINHSNGIRASYLTSQMKAP